MRQQVLVTWVLASSAFTCAVIAMAPILPRASTTLRAGCPGEAWASGSTERQTDADRRVVRDRPGSRRTPRPASPGRGAGCRRRGRRRRPRRRAPHLSASGLEVVGAADGAGPVGQDGVERQVGCVLEERPPGGRRRRSPSVSPSWRRQVEDDDDVAVRCSTRARRSAGTIRCGQHRGEPRARAEHHPVGVADRVDAPRGTAGGSGGSSAIDSMVPAVVATSTWPRTVVSASGSAGSRPRTSAVMSSGVSAIGSTRPVAPSSRPTQSSAATWSPSCSQRLTISRLPTTWPRISPLPAKRCCSTRAQVSPHSSSPHSAASAIRRSPGGSTPNSARSRPDEPPSSATVTTAVRSTRRAGRSADRRGVQPVATAEARRPGRGRARSPSLPPEVAVDRRHVDTRRRAAAGRSPRSSRRCGACRRCSRSRPS